MAKIKTVRYGKRDLFTMDIDINVNKQGEFTAQIPIEIVKKMEDAGVRFANNRQGKPGLLLAKTMEDIEKQINDIIADYTSEELIESKIIIKYAIDTYCHYIINEDKELVPNGTYMKDYDGCNYNPWRNGTYEGFSMNPYPYSLKIYIEPFVKKSYIYKSGKKREIYEHINGQVEINSEDHPALFWLDNLIRITCDNEMKVQEIDYTEDIAEFFVDLVKALFVLNEKIKDTISPETIKILAESKIKLLGK